MIVAYKKSYWPRLLAATLVVAALLISLGSYKAGHASNQRLQKPTLSTHNVTPPVPPAVRGLPVRLDIPTLGIDAGVEYTGLAKNGDMDAPSSPSNVGWYKYGTLPGEVGSSVIAGHVVGSKGERAVFYYLEKLQAGDIISITDAKGRVASFSVSQVKTYDDTQKADEIFTSASGRHLNLITCAGEWDSVHHHYLKRLVVFTDEL